jgi:deazaflavin-dependent oxidoreductase (nitroreductase family)
MANLVTVMSAVNRRLYRATGGRFMNRMGEAPILLLTTVGRTSGKSRTTPLLYLVDGENLVLVASYGGRPEHPAWFRNLEAHPDVEVEIGRERSRRHARVASDAERQRLWPKLVEMYPSYAEYQKRTTRTIPVVVLEPR